MPLEPAAWLIHGASHSAAVGRTVAYAATGGSRGVVLPGDLRVQALQTPGPAVRIAPGAIVLRNASAGGSSQSYVARNNAEDVVEIPANNTSSPVTYFVGVRIVDPEFEGQEPAEPLTHQYVEFLVSTSLPSTVTYEPLARIVLPANTAAITQAMITDLSSVAQPREKTEYISRPIVNADNVGASFVLSHRMNESGFYGEKWPNETTGANDWDIKIPEWARRVCIEWTYYGVRYSGLSQYGGLYVMITDNGGLVGLKGQDFGYDANENGGHAYQGMLGGVDTINLPTDYRGTTKKLTLRGFTDTASPNTSQIALTGRSGISVRLTYQESW